MKTGPTLIALALALSAGGFAGYRLAQPGATAAKLATSPADSASPDKGSRKLLYYRNPMGLPDTSPVPKKDPMGMDYIPVYEGEAESGGSGLQISAEKIQKLGVKTEAAQRRQLDKTIHASGRVEIDESRSYTVTAKFEGYVERLHVNTTGQPVGRGQPLFEVYSPELVSAQREYAIAAQGVARLNEAGGEAQAVMRQLADASLQRLKNWDISDEQLKAIARNGEARRTLTFRSPVGGIVTEKKAIQGMRFMPGEVFSGRVAYVYPTLKSETRSVPVRIELANPKGRLKPAMFAEVDIPVANAAPMITVPNAAVIDSGSKQVVIVQVGEGRFEPRPVKLGQRGSDFVQILDGIREGEQVVSSANFLIDAESNLQAALSGMQKAEPASAGKAATVGHKAEGTLNAIDSAAGSVSISHAPIASLNWPAMKMDFVLANPALVAGLKPGSKIEFEFVERQPGEWLITSLVQR